MVTRVPLHRGAHPIPWRIRASRARARQHEHPALKGREPPLVNECGTSRALREARSPDVTFGLRLRVKARGHRTVALHHQSSTHHALETTRVTGNTDGNSVVLMTDVPPRNLARERHQAAFL